MSQGRALGEFVLGFVVLVAFAWMCAGIALSLLEPAHEAAGSNSEASR